MGASSIPRETLFKMRMREVEDDYASLADDCRYFEERAKELESENAKLRDELAKWERLTANIELPEYPITKFKPKDLERENAKLRELVKNMYGWLVVNYEKSYVIPLNGLNDIERDMRELRIEVEE